MRPNENLLDTLLELQILDRVPRSGYALRGVPDPESVAEHSWHVAFLTWALGRHETELDLGRALEIALIHDVAEVRIGDLPKTAARYLGRERKRDGERAAIAEILAPMSPDGEAIYEEYRRGETREARFVGACDKLQLMLKVFLYESWGAGGLAEFWENDGNFPSPEFATVDAVMQALRRRHAESS